MASYVVSCDCCNAEYDYPTAGEADAKLKRIKAGHREKVKADRRQVLCQKPRRTISRTYSE